MQNLLHRNSFPLYGTLFTWFLLELLLKLYVTYSFTAGSDFLRVDDQQFTFDTLPSTLCLEICILNDDILEAQEEFDLLITQEIDGGNIVINTPSAAVYIIDNSGEWLGNKLNRLDMFIEFSAYEKRRKYLLFESLFCGDL